MPEIESLRWPRLEQASEEAKLPARPSRPDDPPLTADEDVWRRNRLPFCYGAPTIRACLYRGFCARTPACNE